MKGSVSSFYGFQSGILYITSMENTRKTNKIDFIHGGPEYLDAIQPLWLQLNAHHGSLTRHFQEHYRTFTFVQRRSHMLDDARSGLLRVDLAFDTVESRSIGYCVSIIDEKNAGEIESIFVEPEYRGRNIGDELMSAALRWMDEHTVAKRMLSVAVGNEAVLPFYTKFGFYPRMVVLEQLRKDDK